MSKVNRQSLKDAFTTIVFDFDGTLIDSKPTVLRCIRHAMQKMGQPLPEDEDLSLCVGPPLRENFARLLATQETSAIEEALAHYRKLYDQGRAMFDCGLYPKVPELLDALSQSGYALYIATAKPFDFTHQLVEHFKIKPYFRGIYGPNLDGTLDSKEKLVAELVRQEGVLPEKTIMIGDRKHDIDSARSNSIYPAGVTYGYGSSEELLAAGALHLFDSPGRIGEFFKHR